jgi:mRNA-degrading endonuclease RelE of RelBE toxin-antitoxin system
MSANVPYQWLLKISPDAQKRFNLLDGPTKRAIFRKLKELLTADDPYAVGYVEMLQADTFERARKFRAAHYRVFFIVQRQEVTWLKRAYKGTLFFLDVRNRKDAH